MKTAKDIKEGDIFIFNGKEQVSIEDYTAGSDCLAITNKQCFLTRESHTKGCAYGYTNATIISLYSNDSVKIIGNMND